MGGSWCKGALKFSQWSLDPHYYFAAEGRALKTFATEPCFLGGLEPYLESLAFWGLEP